MYQMLTDKILYEVELEIDGRLMRGLFHYHLSYSYACPALDGRSPS